jgi:hypothetical protein
MKINIAVAALFLALASFSVGFGQGSTAQQKIAAVQQAMAQNQQSLSHYQWQQQQTVSVNGDVKSVTLYQVQFGPSGIVKTDISQSASAANGRNFGIRHRIAQNYENYGKQLAALAQSYAQLNPTKLQQLYAQGNVALRSGGAPGVLQLVIHNYAKQGDVVTLTFDRAQKAVLSMNATSYLSAPSDGATIAVQFAKLPDGTNHASTISVNGESKGMTIAQTNMNYQRM